jgi:hypothetical protein
VGQHGKPRIGAPEGQEPNRDLVSCRTTRREIRHKAHNPVLMTANRSNKTIRLTSYAACAG